MGSTANDHAFNVGAAWGDKAIENDLSVGGGSHSAGGARAELLRIAFQEAMQVRMDAFLAGERVYDELVRAAEARCEELLSEARVRADRILSEAQAEADRILLEAVRQARAFQEDSARRAQEVDRTLAEIRTGRSARVQRLLRRIGGEGDGDEDHETQGPRLAAPSPTRDGAAGSMAADLPVSGGPAWESPPERAGEEPEGNWTIPEWLR